MRRRALAGAALLIAGLGAAQAARTPGLGASLAAAYRAFVDPTLLDRPAAPPASPGDERRAALPRVEDAWAAAMAREFAAATDEDLDDPSGATVSTLALPELRVPITRRTLRFVRYYGRDPRGRASFLERFQRAGRYRPAIEQALREAGLPEDLVWVAAVESGFDPRAVSPAGAAGLWQFMPETGALYGLDQSAWVDERRSLSRATTAAVAHLRDLYERFGRWDLALAGYNLGAEGVVRAMQKVVEAGRSAEGRRRPIDLGDLAAARVIPDETADYVPKVAAFAILAQNRARFGLDGVEAAPPLELGELAVPKGTRLRTIARAAGVSTLLLREMNPELLRDRVPPTGGDYLVQLPADRIAHTLAAFPAYFDQEVQIAEEAVREAELPDGPRAPAHAAPEPDAPEDEEALELALAGPDPLPRRPYPLGKNRLPAFVLPDDAALPEPAPAAGLAMATLDAKLPLVLVGGGTGWARPGGDDPLGALTLGVQPLKGRAGAIDKPVAVVGRGGGPALAARLDERGWDPRPDVQTTLANGIAIDVRRDPSAPRVAISVRLGAPAGLGAAAAALGASAAAAGLAGGESRHTVTVAPRDLDVGVSLAAGRLRLLLGEASRDRLAEIRRAASAGRRRTLEQTPYGASWIALGDALFPAGHPLAGTVIGAREDAELWRDLTLAEALRQERAAARATVMLVGDVDPARARSLLEAALARIPPADEGAVGPHAAEERLTLEEGVPSPRALYGWIAPAEGDPADPAMRVAFEILGGARVARLTHALVDEAKVASSVRAVLDVGPRASVAVIEVAPAFGHDLAEVEARLGEAIEAMARAGPSAQQLAIAKALVHARLQRELGGGVVVPGAPRAMNSARLRGVLAPGATEKLLAALDDVSVSAVRAAVRRALAREHRVVVTTLPRAR